MITRMQRDDLLAKLRENRDQHRRIFLEAIVGYREEAVRILEQHIDRIKNGDLVRVHVSMPEPTDHTRDYDRVCAMIELTEDDIIELEEHEFGQYVLDDWSWKQQFLTANSSYSETAARTLTGELPG